MHHARGKHIGRCGQDARQLHPQEALPLPHRNAAFQQKGSNLIDNARALADQPLSDAMESLEVELIGGLRRHELHRRPLHGFGNRLRVADGIGAHVPRRYQPRIVSQCLKPATEMMCPNAGLHADQTLPHTGKPCLYLAARPLLAKHNGTAIIEANDVERVLPDINADYRNRSRCCRRHEVLLVLAPLASLSLAGQEHGRTIALADIEPVDIAVTAIGPSPTNTSTLCSDKLSKIKYPV
jgi:hypothetical protein